MSTGRFKIVEATPTIDTAAYASGDLIGDKMSFILPFRKRPAVGVTAMLRSAVLLDLSAQGADIDAVLFDADPDGTTFTDNAAFDIADADLAKVLGVVPLTTHKAFDDNGLSQALDVNLGLELAAAANTLFAALVARGAATYAATSDLTLRLAVEER